MNTPRLLREAEQAPDVCKLADMPEDVRVIAGRVMTDLTCLCRGAALKTIVGLEETTESDNGFEAWRRLSKKALGGGGIKRLGLLNQITHYNFAKGDVVENISD